MKDRSRDQGKDAEQNGAPLERRGILAEFKSFFLNNPPIQTLIEFNSTGERENYSQRIMQRLGVDVAEYTVLNIHKIGINAPVSYVFEELLKWDGGSRYWPNRIATADRLDGRLEHIQIFLLGRKRYPVFLKNGLFGIHFIPLFNMTALRFQYLPNPADFDNARYLLYKCSGGYPIGIFAMYVRSSIAEQEEQEPTQLFLVVGFDFYGREDFGKSHVVSRIWERVHNRVTSNVMNRFKDLCEWKFKKIQQGL